MAKAWKIWGTLLIIQNPLIAFDLDYHPYRVAFSDIATGAFEWELALEVEIAFDSDFEEVSIVAEADGVVEFASRSEDAKESSWRETAILALRSQATRSRTHVIDEQILAEACPSELLRRIQEIW
ncbi:hypothetical protein HUN59_18680 [Curtobacterium sp. Csp2]|uniref:hypothetical protein n=1 Tax=Curtobacterium sp. Csp2 TaxID=2495430 RepID=UPI00157FD74A|nr:hypothetical protein [Curtobacterium sp. Csp2]QKS17972.1 hypothetical protein HUN59_18680 [Curtobacterium sp. Csp2]